MTKRRDFTADFKAKVVLQVLTGAKSSAQACREYNLHINLLTRWKNQFLDQANLVFERPCQASPLEERIVELERMVGKLTMELEVSKKPPIC